MIVNLHVTSDCNLRCDYCYASPKRAAHMDLATAVAALDLAEQEARDICVIFFGGEPLLRRNLIEQVVRHGEARARQGAHGYSFQISTNGVLLDQEFLRFAREHYLSISLSLDGDRTANDSHRRLPNGRSSFSLVMAQLPALVQSHPYAHVQLVISPDTAPRLTESVAFLFDSGIRFVSTALDYNGPWNRTSVRSLAISYRKLGELYRDKTLRGDKFFLSCFDARIRSQVRGPCKPSQRCSIGVGQFSVAPSGRLYPCVQFVRDDRGEAWLIGDVHRGFDEPARRRLHDASEADKEQCAGCVLAPRCTHWCACVNWASSGRLDRVPPILCEHERLLIPIADAVATELFKRRSRSFVDKHYNEAFPIVSALEDLLEEKP